jgi:DNA-binding winged helix-turn-helix (wHTH) protein
VGGDFRVGPWLVQPSLNTISNNGTRVQLEPKVMSVLVCLAERPGEPVSKEQLLKTVWSDTFVGEGVLTRAVFELRRVFEDEAKEPRVIQTIAKRGYRLVAPVTPVNGDGVISPRIPKSATAKTPTLSAKRLWYGGLALGSVVLVCGLLFALDVGGFRSRWHSGETPAIRSLAVLPLQNLSGDPRQDYFADAMTEELITELSRISALNVIS